MTDLEALVRETFAKGDDSPAHWLPAFANTSEPKFLGYAGSYGEVDILAIESGISAEKVSIAHLNGDERRFYVLHG
jgi:hypothetical protein